MPDFYEQPAYLKELEPQEVTIVEEKPKPKIPAVLIFGVIGLVVFLLSIFLLSSSSTPRRTTSQVDSNTNSQQKVVLQWWGAFLDKSAIQPLIDEYQLENPNVTIEYTNKWPEGRFDGASRIYRSELNRVLRENDPVKIPDIFMVHNSWAGDYENYTRPSNIIDFETFKNTFVKSVVADFGDEDRKLVYGVPLWIDTLAIIYNKDLLLEVAVSTPPTTWPSFKSLAQNLTVKNGNNIVRAGFAAGTASNTSFAMELFHVLMRQNGVEITNSQGAPIFSENQNTLIALEYYKSFSSNTGNTWSRDLPSDAQMFIEGKLAMMVGTSYRYREILRVNESFNLGLDIGISQLPQLQGQDQPIYNWADYWGNMVALNRPNTSAAWAFLDWLSKPAQLRKLHTNVKNLYGYFGNLYPRIDMTQDLELDEYLRIYNESIPYAESWRMIKGIEVREEFNKLLNATSTNQNAIAQTNNAIQLILTLKGKL